VEIRSKIRERLFTSIYCFDDLGKGGTVTQSSHLEKTDLVELEVGKDNISVFTTNP